MITATRMLYLYVETPLHAGVGSGLSSIDLPIQRERPTQYPMIQGSGIKGKLRATAEDAKDPKDGKRIFSDGEVDILFGPSAISGKASEHAGALSVGDARILLFPVRSLNGVFAFTTSCDVLSRFRRDLERMRPDAELSWRIPGKIPNGTALVTQKISSEVCVDAADGSKIVLEEFTFTAQESDIVDEIAGWIAKEAIPEKYSYWREKLMNSLVILPNSDFRDFVLYSTEIVTRVKLERATKTVGEGPWTEEHLPTDTLLYVPIYATNSRKKDDDRQADAILEKATLLETRQSGYIQFGGDETVGHGIVRIHWEIVNLPNKKE